MADLDPVLMGAAQDLLARGQHLDTVLAFLRARDCTVLDCIKAVRALTNCSLAESKRVVHTSAAWADQRAAHDQFHDSAVEAVRTLAREDARVSLRESGSEISVDIDRCNNDAPAN